MMLLFDLFRTRLATWHPLLSALLCALICGACAQDVQAPDRPSMPTTSAIASDGHVQKKPAQPPHLSPAKNKARPGSSQTAPTKPKKKPVASAARPKKHPRATAPAVPPPAPSQSNFISANTLEYLGQKEHLCALTFDDGPTPYTPKLLQLLRERGIKATFFLLGSKVRSKPDLVRRIVAEGHEVANHSYSHPKLSRLSEEEQRQEIAAVQALFHKLGVESRFLRPPYGSFNSATLRAAAELDLDIILWSVDTNDWRHTLSIDGMSSRRGHDRPTRGVFLFHDTHLRTINALPVLIDFLEASQCRFVTLSEYVGKPPLAGLKPQIAPVAAPSPADAALPQQFPADDGSDDDMSQLQTTPPSSAHPAVSPKSSSEVILPLRRDGAAAPSVTPLPTKGQPDTPAPAGPTSSNRQPAAGASVRIPITWDPAPTPPSMPSSGATDGTPQSSNGSGQPSSISEKVSPASGSVPAPAMSATSTVPAHETQPSSFNGPSVNTTQGAASASRNTPDTSTSPASSAGKEARVTPTPIPLPSAQHPQGQSTIKVQPSAQKDLTGPSMRKTTPGSGNVQTQQPDSATTDRPSPAEKSGEKHAATPSKGEGQSNGSFWKIFDFSL